MRLPKPLPPSRPIDEAWEQGWAPPDRGDPIAWMEEHIVLPSSYAFEGPLRFSINRALIEPIRAALTPGVREVYKRKPIQFGGSLILDILQAWIMLQNPGPMLVMMQSDDDMSFHAQSRLFPLFRLCKPLNDLLKSLPARAWREDRIFLPSMTALYGGINQNNAQSKSIRWLLCDELWMPPWQKLWVHAKGRVTAYEKAGTSKIIGVSQAGNKGDVEDRCFTSGSQSRWHYRAEDGVLVPLDFGGKCEDGSRWGLVWDDKARIDRTTWNIPRACETARYVCKRTGKTYLDEPGTAAQWNENGAYQEMNTLAMPQVKSFATNALLNRSMADLVREKLEADKALHAGNPEPMRDYVRKREARPWEEKQESISLIVSKSGYNIGPDEWAREFKRTMTIDRQQGRAGDVPHWWVNVRAWRKEGGSRLLFFGRVETIEAVREIQKTYGVGDRLTWQDAGFDAPNVYQDCVRYGWVATFGSNSKQLWEHPGPNESTVKRPYSALQHIAAIGGGYATYLHWGTNYAKDILSNLLAGRGMLWELPDDLPQTYRDQLTTEHRIEKASGVWAWEKITDKADNHMWDTEAAQVIAGILMGCIATA
jgi:hypothetical protein